MNKIVKEHYPVSKLPPDLREGLDAGEQVRITIETTTGITENIPENDDLAPVLRRPERPLSLEEIFALRRPVFSSGQEIDDHVRRMRDEWD